MITNKQNKQKTICLKAIFLSTWNHIENLVALCSKIFLQAVFSSLPCFYLFPPNVAISVKVYHFLHTTIFGEKCKTVWRNMQGGRQAGLKSIQIYTIRHLWARQDYIIAVQQFCPLNVKLPSFYLALRARILYNQ